MLFHIAIDKKEVHRYSGLFNGKHPQVPAHFLLNNLLASYIISLLIIHQVCEYDFDIEISYK